MPLASFEGLHAHGAFLEEAAGRMKQGREIIGDYLHQKPKPILVDDSTYVVAGFSALFQGDHLGVEVATLAHSNLLIDAGLLDKRHRLQGGIPLREDQWAEGLVIDDYFVISKELVETSGPSVSATKLGAAKACYQKEGIMGSDDKDVVSAAVFKVCGVEIDSREEMVKKGAITAGAPAEKRFALALLAARSAALPYTSDALHSCLLGSLVSVSLMRRHVLAILNEMFHVIPSVELAPGNPMLRPMSRKAADELALMSFLLPIAVSNLAASMSEEIFATDASLAKGAVVSTVVNKALATARWRSADQRVRGIPMMRAAEAVAAWADPMFEPCPREYADEPSSREIGDLHGEGTGDEKEVPRPLGLWFQFLEICGGAGVVTREVLKLGIVAGPVFDLSFSSQYDMVNHNVVMWFIHMMEEGRLLSWLCSPPCTSFSPAAFPAVRSYACPEGFDQENPKVKIGNKLSYGMLDLMMVAKRTKVYGMGETPRRSKMRWLRVWRRLQRMGAKEVFLDSCAYGSIHQKGFCFLTINMAAEALSKKCSRDHTHVRIEGKYTKGSAVYCDGLAEALARCFHDHIKRRLRHEEEASMRADGLEDVVTNDLCVTRPWTTKKVWRWRGKSHINILESAATLKLASSMARSGGDVR